MEIATAIKQVTGAKQIQASDTLQSLWSGYGEIRRYHLVGGSCPSVVVKQICPPLDPSRARHPRGWSTDHGHRRKLASYQVECHWYQHLAAKAPAECRLPRLYGYFESQQAQTIQQLLILEDLDAAGFPSRCRQLDLAGLLPCLAWLANFHAYYLQSQTLDDAQLGVQGAYWHLKTRPDEWQKMPAGILKQQAVALDLALANSSQTLIHGDAKLANFCFAADLQSVAVVDFQYLGRGCGMQDLAYFLRSSLAESSWEDTIPRGLDLYFEFFQAALACHNQALAADQIIAQWRPLFAIAWADFLRFLSGWRPGFELNRFDQEMIRQALLSLERT